MKKSKQVPIFVHGKHVEVSHVIFMGLLNSFLAFLLINEVSYVLHHKLALQLKINIDQVKW